ncbi:MAG: hypothetical protein Q4F31_10920 [Eubacteriales bacterium]|nr:hypothetical protein [Eubacteriales bacterium]
MEKITKEELLEELKLNGVSDEDLAKIAGGEDASIWEQCMQLCLKKVAREHCERVCSSYK